MPQGSVLGQLLFLLFTSELFFILENKLVGYADDSTLMAVVPSPGIRVAVAESLTHDLGRVSHAVLWSHIGTLMHRLAAEPRSTTLLLFPFWCPSGTILLTPYSMVWDWLVSRAGPMLFYWPKLLYPYYCLLLFFPLSSFCLYIGWYCEVFGLIGCISLSLSLAMPTFFNNNNNNNYYCQ